MFGVSTWQLIFLLIVVLLLFGNRLPSVMRNMGKSVTEFKKGVRDAESDESETADEAKHVE
ncbi:MAG: twin-arginine translocase TatA/TatE family subunit [Planctomycetota bacterium]|nr:MAG: twin-arginine translocase TatA/TatE family subunit [Planctomycetota bacterium]REJ92264.1 MAG: twin-arginine translocase TatA/TatE family subunit [Planctomycetota bacterium]REK29814.1 MAG: twin-arginine translocase TatA/TatE family subunit [Planctomycetota bacterium]REK30558.1 MAG: twin-arginine translocase TatA/TatE family subunit [Planctomycetota bacterium]